MKTNKSTQHHTPLKNPLNPKKIIDSLPFAVFTRDENFSVTGMNNAFRDLFPHAEEFQHTCFNVIFGDEKTEPCANCLIDNAIHHRKQASREVTVTILNKKISFRMVAVPILADDGSIESVYKYIEDITARSTAEETISRYSNHLAHLTEESVLSLKKNEQDLSHISNSFHEINMAKDITSLVQEIVNGFIKFRAFPVFFAPYDNEQELITSVTMYPPSMQFGPGEDVTSLLANEFHPFNESARSRIFAVYNGTKDIEQFITRAFPHSDDEFRESMEKILNDKTVVVLPLATESTVEAIVALCMTPAHMMEHFDHYRYLAKYSAMSLAKQTSSLRVQQAQMMTIVSLAKLMEFRDAETGEHLERLMKYTEILARELSNDNAFTLEINDAYISDLVNSCLLHDIGKVGIPDHILKKPSKLTFEEYEMMKQHAIFGAHSLVEAEKRSKGRTFLSMSKEIALYHHEWWNGTGYPHRLKEEQIPLSARIVAVVDVYDALRSHRSYKDSMTHEESCFIIRNESGTHFDPRIVDAFLRRERDIYEHSIEPGEHLL